MELVLSKDLELYENSLGVFDERIPENSYEIVLRGRNRQQLVYEGEWTNKAYFKKDEDTDKFIEELLAYKEKDLTIKGKVINAMIQEFVKAYCQKYELWEGDYKLEVLFEEDGTIKDPFEIFITYYDGTKYYEVK